MSLFWWTQRKIFWRMWETEQFWAPLTSIVFFSPLWKSMVPQNSLLTNFLQNIFLCVQQNKDIHTGLELTVSKWWQNFHFNFFISWVNYPFNHHFSTKILNAALICVNTAERKLSKYSCQSYEILNTALFLHILIMKEGKKKSNKFWV